MKRMNSKKVAFALAILSIAALTIGCGQPPTATMPPAGLNGAGYGLGQCLVNLIPAVNGAPITSVAFNATGIMMNSDSIVGGTVPLADSQPELNKPTLMNGGKIAGTITVSAGSPVTAGQYVGTGVDGNIYLNITPTGQSVGGTLYGMTVNGTGTVSISSTKLSTLPDYVRMMQPLTPGAIPTGPIPTLMPSQYCINGMAMSISSTNAGRLYAGRIYFYTNTISSTGYAGYPTATPPTTSGHGFYLQF